MTQIFKSFKHRRSKEEQIYDECHKKLFYISLRILNNSMEAEEVMHDTLLKYFSREEFNSINERDSWLSRVCINLSIDRLRKRKSNDNLMNSEELRNQSYDNDIYEDYSFKGISVNQVKEAINRLADGYRLVLSLVLFEGYDYEEIAQITGLKEVSVRTQFIRGKAGSKERFMNKISRGNNKTLLCKMPYWTKLAVASSIIIMIALPAVLSERSSKLDSGEYYIEILAKQTMEIEKLSSNLGDYEKLNIESTLRQLNEESVPLADQLPNSISKRERREILKEYYAEKIDGAERLEKYVLELVGK